MSSMVLELCTPSQVAECGEKNDEGGFPWPGEIPNRKRWVKEWNDSVACGTIDSKLHVVARHVVGAMHQKYGGSNSSQ